MPGTRGASMQAAMTDHFQLFGLEPAYALETERLEHAYREIQARIHPDRFAQGGEAERRASMQWTTRVNEAYRTLKDPVQRGKYLLELNGVDAGFETNTSMPAEFLAQQMELREGLAMAAAERDAGALERLRTAMRGQKRTLVAALARRMDTERDYAAAASLVRELMFLDRLDAEIDAAFEELEA